MILAGCPPDAERTHFMARRPFILAATAVLCLLALWRCLTLDLDASSLPFFPDDAPAIRRMAKGLDMLPMSRMLLVDIAAQSPNGERALAEAARDILALVPKELATPVRPVPPSAEGLLRLLPSLLEDRDLPELLKATMPGAIAARLAEAKADLERLPIPGMARDIAVDPLNLRNIVRKKLPAASGLPRPDPSLGFPVSRDGRHVLLAFIPAFSMHDVEKSRTLMDAVDAASRRLPPDMRLVAVGGVRHTAANAEAVQRDVSRIVLLSLVCFAIVYAVFVRSLPACCWLLATPAVAGLLGLGLTGALHPVLSGLAMGFGASVLGLAEDYALHVHFAMRGGVPAGDVRTLLARPLSFILLLNGCAFAVLALSGIPAVRQTGMLGLCTLVFGYLLALLVLPQLPGFAAPGPIPPPAPPMVPRTSRIAPLAIGLAALCTILLSRLPLDADPRLLGADAKIIAEDTERLRDVWGNATWEALVVEDPKDLPRTLASATDTIKAMHPAWSVVSPSDIVPPPERIEKGIALWKEFLSERPELAQAVTAAGRSQGFAETAFAPFTAFLDAPVRPATPDLAREAGLGTLVDGLVSSDGDMAAILLPPGLNAGDLPPELASRVTLVNPRDVGGAMTAQLDAEKRLIPAAWLCCTLLLLACLRSIPLALLAMLPPLCSLCVVLGWLTLAGIPATLAVMAAMPLVLGLAADHGVMVAHHVGSSLDGAIRKAIIVSSLTAICGMGALAVAGHPALRSMGQVICLGLGTELATAAWLLPRLCSRTSN